MKKPLAMAGAWVVLVVLNTGCATSLPAAPAAASTASLINTYWKLRELGNLVIVTPADAPEMHIVLRIENQAVGGFAGCNNLFGRYLLDGESLKFDGMGGTRMACEGRLELEQQFFELFAQVARWKITGETLELNDAGGKTLARFEAVYLP